jgi:spore germination protein YaaH
MGYPNGGIATWHLLVKTKEKRNAAIDTIMTFINTNTLDGIEIDFEPSFTTSTTVDGTKLSNVDYENMLTFLDELGTVLQSSGKKLNIAIPPMFTWTNSEQLYSYQS